MRGNERARNFTTIYVDGFAGSGERQERESEKLPFAGEEAPEARAFRLGSPLRALSISPGFDHYVFMDSKMGNVRNLEEILQKDGVTAETATVQHGDANILIPKRANSLKPQDRAVVFLDPFGMQLDWSTIEVLGRTQKVDLWLLVPIGQAIIRLLTHKDPPIAWTDRLTRFFGTDEWKQKFYTVKQTKTLFDEDEEYTQRDVDFTSVEHFMNDRLRTVFPEVLKSPPVLMNSKGIPLFALFFAVSNPKGAVPALRIASHLARGLKNG